MSGHFLEGFHQAAAPIPDSILRHVVWQLAHCGSLRHRGQRCCQRSSSSVPLCNVTVGKFKTYYFAGVCSSVVHIRASHLAPRRDKIVAAVVIDVVVFLGLWRGCSCYLL